MNMEGEKSILVRGVLGHTEGWFLFKRTGNGSMKATEVFRNAPKDHLLGEFSIWKTACVQFGSSVYVLGGAVSTAEVSCNVRRIDTKNPQDGWKSCGPLPYPTGSGEFCAAGNLVYMFPGSRPYIMPGGYIYDLSTEKSYAAVVPAPPRYRINESWNLEFCVACEFGDGNRGVVARVWNSNRLKKYEVGAKFWEEFDKLKLPQPLSLLLPEHAFLNGILYISCCDWSVNYPVTTVLHAYDIQTGRPLLGNGKGIELPEFKKLHDVEWVRDAMFLVAVADFKLCYVWQEAAYNVTIATVEVSSDRLHATVSEHEFVLNVGRIQHVIPFDTDQIEDKTRVALERTNVEKRNETKKKNKSKANDEVSPLQNCDYNKMDEDQFRKLMEDNQRLMEDNQRLREENKSLFDAYQDVQKKLLEEKKECCFLVGEVLIPCCDHV